MENIENFKFDMELIICDTRIEIMGEPVNIGTHRVIRGASFKDIYNILQLNDCSKKECKITINIRGVNY